MKRIQFLIVFLIVSVATMAQSQERSGQRGNRDFDPAERAKQTVKQLSETIEINEAETKALETVFTKQMTEMKTMMESGERPSREEMELSREKSNKEVKAILGEERYKTYEKMMEERMQNRGKKRPQRKSSGESDGNWR